MNSRARIAMNPKGAWATTCMQTQQTWACKRVVGVGQVWSHGVKANCYVLQERLQEEEGRLWKKAWQQQWSSWIDGDLLHISNGVCALTNSWVVDSGSFHMSPNRHWLHEYKPLDGSYVLMESNISCKTEGISILRYLKSRCLM